MGPRQKSLGNYHSYSWTLLLLSRFNGAEAKKPRKLSGIWYNYSLYYCFNGAEAKKPRKYWSADDIWAYIVSLQWGRGKKASEINHYTVFLFYTLGASMGPRQKSLGNQDSLANARQHLAASMGPRQKSLGNTGKFVYMLASAFDSMWQRQKSLGN